MTKLPYFTRSGLPGIELIPLGMHACHAYAGRQELASALAAYFAAGLQANERCIWITAPPLPARDALAALRGVFDGVEDALASGALRVLDFDEWYAGAEGLKGLEVVRLWLEEEERALAEGYHGLRVAGNMSFLRADDQAAFIEYEQAVTAGFAGRRIVALCSYPAAQFDGRQMNEVAEAHHCAFERPGQTWQVAVPSAPRVT